MSEKTLAELARDLYHAKQMEGQAKQDRIAIEEQIAAMVTIPDDKQSVTVDAGDGLKVNVKTGINYKVDIEGMRSLVLPDGEPDLLPLKFVPATWAFDKAAYEKLVADQPAVASRLAKYVTTTPAKVSVSLKLGHRLNRQT